ncbi:sulfurtransferase complex subunit TusC [Halomonas urumqiensis]|uniref:Sulfurtransferase complex subunit TusC n=1 Tax=Halomonas urumqiensis TaxID=1684789 RepID=A0A2N7UEK1_9GAMM|nr:sulfurtransferase complex subunit TusC [Halomonas urumqiensis]PMR78884.1 sulfurtransferase complex subunit TusC [Halomonas urumqiensis]PTB04210.1 sulfurtransferase complex subunit TusC [Halomonas urumqiensis]GHE19515.1 protein TusC [Halomonas urumqiensis]
MTDVPPYHGDLLVILRHGPHGSSLLREGLDAALVAAAFGRDVSLLFMGEGISALVRDQQVGPLGQKGTAATLQMLEMYDIDRLLVDGEGLAGLGLAPRDLMLPVEVLDSSAMAVQPKVHRLVLTF